MAGIGLGNGKVRLSLLSKMLLLIGDGKGGDNGGGGGWLVKPVGENAHHLPVL